jgi:hypothetical protein
MLPISKLAPNCLELRYGELAEIVLDELRRIYLLQGQVNKVRSNCLECQGER